MTTVASIIAGVKMHLARRAIDRWPAIHDIAFECTCGLKMEIHGPLTKREHEALELFRDEHVRGHAKLAETQSIE